MQHGLYGEVRFGEGGVPQLAKSINMIVPIEYNEIKHEKHYWHHTLLDFIKNRK